MKREGNSWAIVLAGGEGTRLRGLTTTASGITIPKQFCSLRGGDSLLQEALKRAEAAALPEHICAVVSQHHESWWGPALCAMRRENIIVQPRNCGTANGILWPLLHILSRDPEARVAVLPSDHHVRDEAVLATALRRAAEEAALRRDQVLLIGISPDEVDPDLGYILPGEVDGNLFKVDRFIEKPDASRARALIEAGAVWNTFIVAGRGQAILRLYSRRFHKLVRAMSAVVALSRLTSGSSQSAVDLYRELPQIDFSRDVLEGAETALRLLQAPRCGWSDLGTPMRLAHTLQTLAPATRNRLDPRIDPPTVLLNLAAQHAVHQPATGHDREY